MLARCFRHLVLGLGLAVLSLRGGVHSERMGCALTIEAAAGAAVFDLELADVNVERRKLFDNTWLWDRVQVMAIANVVHLVVSREHLVPA